MCKTPSLLETMMIHLFEAASDCQKYGRLERIAAKTFAEKVNTILNYCPELTPYFTTKEHEVEDAVFEIID